MPAKRKSCAMYRSTLYRDTRKTNNFSFETNRIQMLYANDCVLEQIYDSIANEINGTQCDLKWPLKFILQTAIYFYFSRSIRLCWVVGLCVCVIIQVSHSHTHTHV